MAVFECYPPTDKLMPAAAARGMILDTITATDITEPVSLAELGGRFGSEAVRAAVAIPPSDNSAMDGFAVASRDLNAGRSRLRLVGTAWAGRPYQGRISAGQAVRIMTGGFVPDGADAIVPKEEALDNDDIVEIVTPVNPGQHIRRAGEDTRPGDVVLGPGKVIDGAMQAVLASVGVGRLDVYRRPVVGILSTGDELQEAGQPARAGSIYDSNRPLLRAMLSRLNIQCVDFGIATDSAEVLVETVSRAAATVDVLITSGGASTGAADLMADTLNHLGQVGLWRVALRPGRPFAFGRVDETWLFGLPGNPVAVATTFLYFVRPALLKLMGSAGPLEVRNYPAKCVEKIRKKPNRVEIYRAVLETGDDGLRVKTTGSQGSGLLRSLAVGDGLFTLEANETDKLPGDTVMVMPMSELF